jgi:hypothetical protein
VLQNDIFEEFPQICQLFGRLCHNLLFDVLLGYGVEDIDQKHDFIFEELELE